MYNRADDKLLICYQRAIKAVTGEVSAHYSSMKSSLQRPSSLFALLRDCTEDSPGLYLHLEAIFKQHISWELNIFPQFITDALNDSFMLHSIVVVVVASSYSAWNNLHCSTKHPLIISYCIDSFANFPELNRIGSRGSSVNEERQKIDCVAN